jgi:predicted secreted Zn-dependent protease
MYFSIGVIQSNKIMKDKYAYYRIKSKKKKEIDLQ